MSLTSPNDSASSRRPTLKDVAREAGYHITTISLALRQHPSIPEATRKRIQEIADRIGYERNPVYHALSRFRQQGTVCAPAPRIAYLENFGLGSGNQRSPHLQAILDGACRQAELLGYQIDPLAVGEDDHDSRSLTGYLREHQITGIVMGSFIPGFAEIALNWDDYAVCKIHSRHTEPAATVVGNDQLREVRLAFRRLAALGYERIGLAVGRSDEDACGHRHTAGYLMEEASLPLERRVPPLLFPYNLSESALGGMIARWVRRHRLDAVLCNWATIRTMLEREGLRVPDDVACASLCICDPLSAAMAGVRPYLNLVGERAVSIVVAQLKTSERGLPEFPSSIYVQSVWQDGDSAPRRN
ncbi:LacI family DNA-binding transcriptional regulator [Opitutus terrae]|uniref:Transcriptional regulator, LacI family n=1 Tax=Opitutus terrae (strain DSM 11246 / JCM 15787 / PB90-1) TaxID=452637 RepID=B1ZSF3_OPITP|nr:LacI family DNA-binding transcriptional regulator [Opitutus terrae]ACB73810.1 transcriptional regulator, LacI family [Opitutus terrae PB90-1]